SERALSHLTRIRRIFVIKGEHFFAYQNDARYRSWQIWVGDSPNWLSAVFDHLTARWAIEVNRRYLSLLPFPVVGVCVAVCVRLIRYRESSRLHLGYCFFCRS